MDPTLRKFTPKCGESVLVVIDVQEKLSNAMNPAEMKCVTESIVRSIEGAHTLRVPVLVTEQYPKGLGPTLPPIQQALGEAPVLEKVVFSCCGAPNFLERLKQTKANTAVLVGMETHVCVLQTALDLLQKGYHVQILADAVISRSPENKRIGLDLMREAGAVVSSVETVLFQWTEKAGTEEFKMISRLVR
ncbi:MAG: hydrolase [Deltaproteobacteria bacterium]|nr:hydrolase [Deltaproteobacteria bacterium]